MSKVSDMLDYHLKKEPIVYIIEQKENETIYMIKSIMRDSQTYNIVDEIVNNKHIWTCDCPAFKFRRKLGRSTCKHIDFIQFLLNEKIVIDHV